MSSIVNASAHAHSSESNEHYTPTWLCEAAHRVMGGIDLDPMTSVRANQCVQARTIITEEGDALHRGLWTGVNNQLPRVWLNPPGGKLDPKTLYPLPRNANGKQGGPGMSAAAAAWAFLSDHYERGLIRSAMFLAFSLNVFRTAQDPRLAKFFPRAQAPSAYPFVVFRERIRFEYINAAGERVPGKSPPQDSALVFLPERLIRLDCYCSTSVEPCQFDRCPNAPPHPTAAFLSELSPYGAVRA